jgi:hypothetical protein
MKIKLLNVSLFIKNILPYVIFRRKSRFFAFAKDDKLQRAGFVVF